MATSEEVGCDPATKIKNLSAQANSVLMDKNIPPRRYFRSGIELERMAAIYLDEGNLENAFVLYMKFIVLFVEKLPKHPLYKQADPVQVRKTIAKVKQILPITEKLKMTIKKTYEDKYEEWKAQEHKRIAEFEQRKQQEADAEYRRKQEEEAAFQRLKDSEETRNQNRFIAPVIPIITPTAPHVEEDYPSAPQISEFEIETTELPPPPPYSSIYDEVTAPDAPLASPDFQSEVKPWTTPIIDRSSKPTQLVDRQDSTLVGGLRRIYIPNELVSKFLALAINNTRRNLETCGILTGKLARNLFHITHLVIPKQTATSDSCTTTNEEEMFDVQDKHDLVTLGWIHTHPSQTSFLSSVDLHTQYAYQMLMPEAIAIVCAPKFDQVGVYRLTSDYGLSFVGACSKPGFHPHPKEPPLFEESEHAQLDSTMNIQIIDLR